MPRAPETGRWEAPDHPTVRHGHQFQQPCSNCNGSGKALDRDLGTKDCGCSQRECPYCYGNGKIAFYFGQEDFKDCGACNGFGFQVYVQHVFY